MNPELESSFDEFEKPTIIRRKLLPWWIKTFCWIFMILGVCGIASLLVGPFVSNSNLSIYGFESTTPFSTVGIFIVAILLFKGFTAYSLWFEKSNAITIGKIDAIAGVAICIASMFLVPVVAKSGISRFPIRLEFLFLIPYYLKLNKIEDEWNN